MRTLRLRLFGVLATVAVLLGAAGTRVAVARDFGTPPATVVLPAPTAAGPTGVRDDEPGNNVNERVDTAEHANANGMSDADRKVMKAIRDGVKKSTPEPKPKRGAKPNER